MLLVFISIVNLKLYIPHTYIHNYSVLDRRIKMSMKRYVTWSFTLRLLGKVLGAKRDKITRDWKILRNE